MSLSSLLALPAELLDDIIAHLQSEDVARVSATSKQLRVHASKDSVWQTLLRDYLQQDIVTTGLEESFRDLYVSHYSHWFLVKHQIWFSDNGMAGNLMITRYDPRRGCIEGYTVTSGRGAYKHGLVEWDSGQVMYDTFHPRPHLDLNRARLRLDPQLSQTRSSHFSPELLMDVQTGGHEAIKFSTTFMHCTPLTEEVGGPSSASVWPPRILPSCGGQRVRNVSHNAFRSSGHIPKTTRHSSGTSFRIREWMEFPMLPLNPVPQFVQRVNREVVNTYATLPREAYTPSPQKPWQGIWAGDYNTHGVEFLAILQPDDPLPLPRKAVKAVAGWPNVWRDDLERSLFGQYDDGDDEDEEFWEDACDHIDQDTVTSSKAGGSATNGAPSIPGSAPYRGRLEAVKLTGDPNIPRGEYTFIANDLDATVRHTHEAVFQDELTTPMEVVTHKHGQPEREASAKSQLPGRLTQGARAVKSVGHVAGHGFQNDAWIPTELILISEDTIAQYWRKWRHISFYRRVDLNALMKQC